MINLGNVPINLGRMKMFNIFMRTCLAASVLVSCNFSIKKKDRDSAGNTEIATKKKPNIIFILADD